MTPEEKRAYRLQYDETHKEELKAKRLAYNSSHREELRAKDRARYHQEKEKRAEKAKKQRLQPDFKERKSILMRQYRNEIRTQIIQSLGAKCSICGFEDIRALQIDHVIPLRQGGHSRQVTPRQFREMMAEIETNQHNYQILCANCHCIKTKTNGEDHPHRKYI